MKQPLFFFIFIIGLIVTISAKGQNADSKTLIIGDWKFDKLEFKDDFAAIDKKEQDRLNKVNKGIISTFTNDGKFRTIQQVNGKKKILAYGKYKISANGQFLTIDGVKAALIFISDEKVKLYAPDKPSMFWIKVKQPSRVAPLVSTRT